MATVIIPIGDWRQLDKTGWHKLIVQWNQRKGHMKKIARPVVTRTSYMTPQEEREVTRERKRNARRPLAYVPEIQWDEVPQHLPYVFGCQEIRLPEEKRRVKQPDPEMVYVDATFWDMIQPE